MIKTEYKWEHSHEDNSFHYLIKSINKIMLNDIKIKKNYLDIGCGNGFLTKEISKNFKNTEAIDTSKSAIEFAKKDYDGEINFLNSDIENFKSTKNYDVITLIEVIEHLYSPITTIRKIREIMNKDTILIVSTPYHGYLKNLTITLFNKFDNHVNPLWDHGHIKFWSVNTLSKLFIENGFKVQKITFSGRFFPLSKSMIFLIEKL